MIVVHLSSASFDSGAGIAVLNLHKSMLAKGIDSRLYTPHNLNERDVKSVYSYPNKMIKLNAKLHYMFDRFLIRMLGYKGNSPFSLLRRGKMWPSYSELKYADIIHLHWVGDSFINLKDFDGLKAKFVWTLRDWWPLTGLCHLPNEYSNKPERHNSYPYKSNFFLSRLIKREQYIKKSFLKSTSKVRVVAQSKSMKKDAKKALGLSPESISVIPSSINDKIYKYTNKSIARERLGFSQDDSIIAIGATNVNDAHKGFDILKKIPKNSKLRNSKFISFGAGSLSFPDGIKIYEYGFIKSEFMMRDIYAASDILMCPSIFESFGKVVLESISCGTPVIAFEETGHAEIIKKTGGGKLAFSNDAYSFFHEAETQMLEITEELRADIAKLANKEYSLEKVLKDHISLYSSLIEN